MTSIKSHYGSSFDLFDWMVQVEWQYLKEEGNKKNDQKRFLTDTTPKQEP